MERGQDEDAELALALSLEDEDDSSASDASFGLETDFRRRSRGENGKRQSKSTKRFYTSANHLVSFSLTERPKPVSQPKRSYQPATPFSKERFLQANYRFVVSDGGDYKANLADADLAADWDLVEEVCFCSDAPYNCPICLEPCVAPKALKCGHVYCWSCIIHHLSSAFAHNYTGKCPICSDFTTSRELKSVVLSTGRQYRPGDTVDFVLLQRSRDSVVPMLREHWRPQLGRHPDASSADAVYSRFAVTADISGILERESAALGAAARLAESSKDDSLAYILTAMESLKDRQAQFATLQKARQAEAGNAHAPHHGHHNGHHHGHGHAGHHAHPHGANGRLPADAAPAVTAPAAVAEPPEPETPAELVRDPFDDEDCTADAADPEALADDGHIVQQDEIDEESYKRSCKPREAGDAATTPESGHSKLPVDTVNNTSTVPKARRFQAKDAAHGPDGSSAPSGDVGAMPEFFFTYQASNGQPLFLHPMDLKILLAEYGRFDRLPSRIRGTVLEMEPHTQTEASRKRYRAVVGHLPISCNFHFVEVDMRPLVSWDAIRPHFHDIQKRAQRRRRLREQDWFERQQEASERERRGLKASLHDPAEFPHPQELLRTPPPGQDDSVDADASTDKPPAAAAGAAPLAEPQPSRPIAVPSDGAPPRDTAFPLLSTSPANGSKGQAGAPHSAPHAWGRSQGAGVSFRDAVKAPPKKEAFEIPRDARVKKNAKGGTQFVTLFSSGSKRSYK